MIFRWKLANLTKNKLPKFYWPMNTWWIKVNQCLVWNEHKKEAKYFVVIFETTKETFKRTCYLLVVCLCFFYLDPLQNQAIMTSRFMTYIFCWGREVKQADKSVQPVKKKEGKGKGKWTIDPRMKNGCAKAQT